MCGMPRLGTGYFREHAALSALSPPSLDGDRPYYRLTISFTCCPSRDLPSNQRDELPLGLGVPLDVPLRHRQVGMPREFLHVPQTAPNLRHFARGARNEGPTARVR